uniref:Uncharacterized protein n=1 Tax=Siphoviridae sp. ctxMM9 TaxID=2827973 RepID=A0A8S5T6K7_9CAUD|nr:MAG TPA: hypothetical protein [Siphoviridae sp. ctxMM9]
MLPFKKVRELLEVKVIVFFVLLVIFIHFNVILSNAIAL